MMARTASDPQPEVKILPPENSHVNTSKSSSSRLFPCSSIAIKTADEIAPIASISVRK